MVQDSFYSILQYLYTLPQIAILIASIMYITKRTTPDAVLILVSSIVNSLLFLFNIFGYTLFALEFDYMLISAVIGFISFLSYSAFAIGVFLLINNMIKASEGKSL